jgi:hypothetical protein
VTGAHEATARIPHGADVEVDPTRGTVTIHSARGPRHSDGRAT